jgi:plasmid stabilization system protein ParE
MSERLAQLELARAEANLAMEHAPACPAEAARLLHQAAWLFREAGAEAAAAECSKTARELRASVRQPRSRPFVPSAAEAAERRRVADPAHTPTLDEALRNPDAFVEGMVEVTGPRGSRR